MAEEKVQPKKAKPNRPKEPTKDEVKKLQEDKVKQLRQVLGNAVPKADKYFKVKNVVRRVQTRTRRAAAPGRLRFRQQVAGRRLLRGQSMMLRPEVFEFHSEQILRGIMAGALEVTDPDGIRYFVDVTGKLCKQEPGKAVEKREPPPKPEPEEKPEVVETTTEPPPPPVEAVETAETVVEEVVEKVVEPDDLTQLPAIGAGRARKLVSSGVTTFKQVATMSPADLVKVVGAPLTEDQAAEICKAASEMEG